MRTRRGNMKTRGVTHHATRLGHTDMTEAESELCYESHGPATTYKAVRKTQEDYKVLSGLFVASKNRFCQRLHRSVRWTDRGEMQIFVKTYVFA